ncbi:phage tail protein [Streptomyces griseocarneus]|uniref:phage tail protein n=1 Tax=Streptomyces griseocarneus TaxID=51201 RepID=UPI00167CC7BF|nr:phage tail protein [Streptomyces griseocarneus]MBZ6476974.1 phage tail protein [Streptomyces griseocarneus]GHG76395.1 hypothetical protein GCM10018779_54680 [Streptomyces griseocarneus]
MLPNGIPTVTVTGRYLTPTGEALSGTVTFRAPSLLTHTGSDVILGGPIVAVLDAEGRIKATLPATDTPGMNPAKWTYNVTERLSGIPVNRTYEIAVPAAQPTVDLADIAPVDPEAPHYVAVAGPPGPAGAPGPAGTPGAPGLVRSVNGRSVADITLTADDVRAVPAASVGAANGVAGLDASGKVPAAQLPPGAVSAVSSVNTKKGAVVLTAADVGALDQAAADLRYVQQAAVPVKSVNGRTGQVVLDAAALGAVPAGTALLLAGDQSVDGAKTFTTAPASTAQPTAAGHLATKGYVDSLAAPGTWGPRDLGFGAWTFDPAAAAYDAAQFCVPGTIYLIGINLPVATKISNLVFYVLGFNGTSLSTASYAGLYTSAGNRVGDTAPLTNHIRATFGTTVVCPLTTAYDAAPGTYWIALLINGPSDDKRNDGPGFAAGANAGKQPSSSARMPGAFTRYGRLATTGQTSLPASFKPSSSTIIEDANAIWAAVA